MPWGLAMTQPDLSSASLKLVSGHWTASLYSCDAGQGTGALLRGITRDSFPRLSCADGGCQGKSRGEWAPSQRTPRTSSVFFATFFSSASVSLAADLRASTTSLRLAALAPSQPRASAAM